MWWLGLFLVLSLPAPAQVPAAAPAAQQAAGTRVWIGRYAAEGVAGHAA